MLSKGLVGALVVAVAATGIAVAEAGGGANRPAPFKPFPQHVVAAPSTAIGGKAARRRAFTKVKYVESNTATVEAGSEISGFLKCPRRSAAISGYFRNNRSGVVLDFSSVGNTVRKWDFALLNLNDSESARALVGVVCIK
ncbi:MAG TPA: hypothetical protein VH391_08965 [Solirubrobacterales bacterium]|jgi:hypothetical protein